MNRCRFMWQPIVASIVALNCGSIEVASGDPAPLAGKPVFAAILPLTGNAADQGEWARRGFEIARDELKVGKREVQLIYEDSKGGDPTAAVQAYKALQVRNRVPVVFTFGSGVGMALSPLVNADRVIQMGIATATPKYSSPADYTFRNFPSASDEAVFIATALAKRLHIRKIALLNIESDYGVGTAKELRTQIEGMGGSIVFSESYAPPETDFKPLLLKVKQSDAELVFLASYPTDGALILKQAKQLGIGKQFAGSVAIIGGKEFFELAGDAAEGLLVASSIPAQDTSFGKRYEQLYPGESPAQRITAARCYDALMVVAQTLEKCVSAEAGCIKDELFKVHEYRGASGNFSFDPQGDITAEFAFFKIRNQAFAPF